MKFQQLPQNSPKDSKESIGQYFTKTSPLLENKDAQYVLRMRRSIKNSFPDQLAVLKGQKPIAYESDDPTLRARSHIYRVPSLLPPQLSFQIADKIAEQQRKLEAGSRCKIPELKFGSNTVNSSRVQSRFSHRSSLKELEAWLKKKLSTIPQAESDVLQYKNLIVGLGMKELVRLLKTRCEQEGQLLESLWENMWKVCQQVIRFLTNELNLCRANLNEELKGVESLFVVRLTQCNSELTKINERLAALQKQNSELSQKLHRAVRSNKELKASLSQSSDSSDKFEQEYMRVLEENLMLQLPNIERRQWIRRMYRSIKCYKQRIAKHMKANIKQLVIDRAQMDGEVLDIDFDGLENIDDPYLKEQLQGKEEILDMQFATKCYGVQAVVVLENVRTQTHCVEYASCHTETDFEKMDVVVQTAEDWISHETLSKINMKLKLDKEKLEQRLRAKPSSGSKLGRRESLTVSVKSSNKMSFQGSQSELSECVQNSDENFEDLRSRKDISDKENKSIHSSQSSGKINQKILRKGSIRERRDSVSKEYFQGSTGFQKQRKGSLSSFEPTKFAMNRSMEISIQQNSVAEMSSLLDQNTVLEENEEISQTSKSECGSKKLKQTSPQLTQKERTVKEQLKLNLQEGENQKSIVVDSDGGKHLYNCNTIREEPVYRYESEQSERCSTQRDNIEERVMSRESSPGFTNEPQQPLFFSRTNYVDHATKRLSITGNIGGINPRSFVRGRKSTILGRGQRFQSEKLQEPKEEVVELTGSDAELFSKLQRYNFQTLSRVRCNRNEFDYRELMRETTYPCNTQQKKMELAIDKELVTVLVEMLKYYRKLKVLKQHTAKAFLRNLQPLPLIIIQKFSQKYGVKTLAVKHFRQVLAYTHQLKDKYPRYSLLHLLLFSDFKVINADPLRLFLKLLNALDPQYTMLRDNATTDRDMDQVELKDSAVAEACLPYFPEAPEKTEHTTTISTYVLRVINLLIKEQSAKTSELNWLYHALCCQQGLQLEVLASFTMNLNYRPEIEIYLLKEIFSSCDYRSTDGKYEMSEERFVSFLASTDYFTLEFINKTLTEYNSIYLSTPPTVSWLSGMLINSSIVIRRLCKYLLEVLNSEGTLTPEAQLIWKYMQFTTVTQRIRVITNEIIGDWIFLGSRERLIASQDATLFTL